MSKTVISVLRVHSAAAAEPQCRTAAVQTESQDVDGFMWWTIPAGLLMGYGAVSIYNDFVGRDETYHKYDDKP